MDESVTVKEPLFKILAADDDDTGITEIESLCMACEKNGVTRLLLTKIPLFKEVVVSSFHCSHCGDSNSSMQSAAAIEERGVKYQFRVQELEQLNRLVVKADTAAVVIPELDFEIPPHTQKGSITTIESIILQSVEALEKEQPVRKTLYPDLAAQLDVFIERLKDCAQLKQPFTLVMDDPAGNSFIENKLAPNADPQLVVEHYMRSEQQNKEIGADTSTQSLGSSTTDSHTSMAEKEHGTESVAGPVDKDEVIGFKTNCSLCNSPTETRMKLVDIPHFKQVVIMATSCNYCGYSSNEVKSGTGVSETGTRIKLRIMHMSDLSRDVHLSETSMLSIPSLDFECAYSSVAGKFTTIEGILVDVKAELQKANPFSGDSASDSKLKDFLEKLSEVIEGKKLGVDIILDDPAGNVFIQNLNAPEPDPEMSIIQYQRTFEQNEQLGLNSMKTENYCDQ